MSKNCTQCKIKKKLTEFHLFKYSSDGFKSICKSCISIASAQYRENNIKKINISKNRSITKLKENKKRVIDWILNKYKDIPCMDCGGVFEWCVMDFDHRLGEIKELKIGNIGLYKATPERITQLEKEIDKCDLVCSNCHRVRTYITRKK